MTRQLLLFLLIVLFSNTRQAKAQLWLGEVAHWDFNGSVADVSGHGHNGNPTNVTSAIGKDGTANSAYYFDGTGYVTVPYDPDLNVTEFSIAAIIKPTGFYTGYCQGNCVITRGSQGQPGNYGLIFTDNPYDFENYTLYDTNYYVFEAMTGQTTYNSINYQYTPTIHTNNWYTVIVTYGNSEVRVFLDGVLKSTTPIISGSLGISLTDGIGIGKNTFGGSTFPYPFKGYIDDIRLYNRVLPDSDIIAYSRKLYIKPPFNDTFLCVGKSFNLEYTCKQPFNPGNTFTAQLSDPVGSFVTPINIGTVTSYNSGSIPCTIPANISLGAGYRIRIIATNEVDTSLDNGKNIFIQNVYAIPTLTGNTPVCEGSDTIHLSVTSSPTATSYTFRGPGITGGISGIQANIWNVKLNYAGDYIVESNYKGCSSFDTVTIAVKPRPTALSVDTIKLCTGDSLRLSGTSNTSGASFKWSGPDTMSASVADTTIFNVSKKNAGIYSIRAVFNGCTSVADTTYAVVNPRPQPVIGSNSPVCAGDSLSVTATDTLSGVIKYSWTGPDGFISASRDTFIRNSAFANSGKYILTATSAKNCSASDQKVLTVKPLPQKPVLSNNGPLCSNNTLELKGTSTTGTTWSWSGPNGFNSTEQNPKIANVQMANAGTYKAIANLDGCVLKDSTTVVLDLTPDAPSISSNSPLQIGKELKLFSSTTTPGVSYKWSGPNGFSSLAQNPVITRASALASGTYIVTVTLGVCSSSSLTVVLVRDDNVVDSFMLYPNPNKGKFTLVGNTKTDKEMPIEIISETGQVVYSDIAMPVNNQLKKEIQLEGALNSGVYILRISINGEMRLIKFSLVR